MKFLAVFAPSQDTKDRFFSTTPTSLGWALAPLIHDIDTGKIENIEYVNKVYDPLHTCEKTFIEFDELVATENPDLLVMSSTYDSHFSAKRLAAHAKLLNPEIQVIYGGPHIDEVCSREVMKYMPQIHPFNEQKNPFDFLVSGDGELILRQFMIDTIHYPSSDQFKRFLESDKAREKYTLLPARGEIQFLTKDGELKSIESKGNNLDLNRLPNIPRQLFGNELDRYGFSCFTESDVDGNNILLSSVSTMLHRGCRSRCSFCSESGGYNSRNIDHIVSEIEQLKNQGTKGVFFDDSTLSDHENFEILLSELKKVGLQYGSLNRFDKLQNPKYVQALRDSGFVYQYCSIEQYDDIVLRKLGKHQKIYQIDNAVQNLKREGIKLGVSLLFGTKNETDNSILDTLRYTSDLIDIGIIDAVSMSLYSYHPNTMLTLYKPEGKLLHKTLKYDCPPPNQGYPWNNFEEGQWYHPPHLTEKHVERIYSLAEHMIGSKLVRNLRKDGIQVKASFN